MNMAAKQGSRADRFIKSLEKLIQGEDRAALASLRRGLGKPPGEAVEVYRYIFPFTQDLHLRQEDAYYTVATLFGSYPTENWRRDEENKRTNLGASLQLLDRKLA